MKFLLDTCVISDFVQGRPQVLARVKAAAPQDLAVSVITEMEITYDLLPNAKLARRLNPIMEAFFRSIHVIPYERQAARATAHIRANLKRPGQPVGAYDALSVGTALSHDLVLITSNRREFRRIAGLRIEDWRA